MRGKIAVLPEKYSEKNLVSSVMGVINDYIPLANAKALSADEQVFWTKFDDFEIKDLKENSFAKIPLLLSIGTCKSFYFWGLSYEGKATLLFSENNKSTIYSKVLPNPQGPDVFADKRPLLALCDSVSRTCFQWQVRFISLLDNKPVLTLHFESRVLSVDANDRFVVVGRVDCITVLSSKKLTECFTVAGVKPTMWPNNVPKNVPYALGPRWLAYPDMKPIYQQLSRCGDGSSDECQPLTSTVMKVNKRIWSGISAFAGTVVSGTSATGTTGSSPSNKSEFFRPGSSGMSSTGGTHVSLSLTGEIPDSGSTDLSPGYVTVIDLVTMYQRYLVWKKTESAVTQLTLSEAGVAEGQTSPVPPSTNTDSFASESLSGTSYINVHDYCEVGSLVAHFMAHRWAGVALLKFDATGTLLFTACTRGHAFNLFRISNHPCDQRQTAVHHLYILERGNIPCEVVDAAFSRDSRWLAVSSNHGTTHVFPITAYGGAITVRTHTRPYVVNRTSRYHRSSGIEEHQLTRPQRERGTVDSTASLTNLSGLDRSGSVASSGISSLNTCRGAPMAGLTPQCPHLTFATSVHPAAVSGESSSGSFARLGSSNALGPVTDNPSSVATDLDRACACPPNALYNTTNPRLPPYPEPFQIKPQARLRPHNPVNATTGAAAAALGAASGALEAVSTSSPSTIPSQPPQPIGYAYGGVPHCGPCAHCPAPPQARSAPLGGARQPGRPYYQPLPIVDHIAASPFPCPNVSGTLMAACFSPPVCFLPQHPRQSNLIPDYSRDPYGSPSRSVDALFILTNDLYLVEYDLCVGPAETTAYGEKLYQDGSIRLDCNPVGEWNLRADTVYLPPFPGDHPFVLASNRFAPVTIPSTSVLDTDISAASPSVLDEPDTLLEEQSINPKSNSPKSMQRLECSTFTPSRDWNAEDEATYWYSQVEITTHLGPLRRVWMGPQCTFRTYSQLADGAPQCAVFANLESEETATNNTPTETIHAPLLKMLATAEGQKLLPPLKEPNLLAQYYAQRRTETDLSDLTDTASPLSFCSRSSFSGPMITLPESGFTGAGSPVRLYAKTTNTSRLQTSRLMDLSPGSRGRNRSGDVTRPLSIAGDGIDPPVFIEGGSYQDSSLGGSLSSLIGRSADDVASCIADAMQDEEPHWSHHRPDMDSPSVPAPVAATMQPTSVLQFGVRSANSAPAIRPMVVAIQSALSEADFPSQDASPLANPVKDETVMEKVAEPENTFATSTSSNPRQQSVDSLSQAIDVDSSNKADQPSTSTSGTVPKGKKSKRSRKAKNKPHKSGALSATEGPSDETNLLFDKKYHSAMTSPYVSGTESLGSSPAVGEFICHQRKKRTRVRGVSETVTAESVTDEVNLPDATELTANNSEPSKQESDVIHPDPEGSMEQSTVLARDPGNTHSDPTDQQVSEETTSQSSDPENQPDRIVQNEAITESMVESHNVEECHQA